MQKSYVKSALEGLKSSSSSRVQDALLEIRSKIIVNDQGVKLFRDCGGLELLIPHLRKPNGKILDISLSILGNCCLEEESSLTVGKLNTFGPLISILKNVCRDSIVGRACRVIGNLAKKNSNAEHLHNHGAVPALISLIENRDKNTSNPTLTMAVRAIRQLWSVTEKRDEMLSLNSVRCIAILLTGECESAGVVKCVNPVKEINYGFRKSQEELVTGILKCFGYFTTHATAPCAEQIQGDGRGYQCLVALTRIYEYLALKSLINLCYLAQCRPLLGIAGLVECLVGLLKKISEVAFWPEGAALSLAQLSSESVNRSRLRHCGGLPLLVAAAKVNRHAMHALLQYVFDDTSFQILIDEGLIGLLTEELSNYLKTMEYEHINLDSNETLNDHSEPTQAKKPRFERQSEMHVAKEVPTIVEGKTNLFMRRKSHVLSQNQEEFKIEIERDSMIVGFVDAIDSNASDESQSGEDSPPLEHKSLKRTRPRSPVSFYSQQSGFSPEYWGFSNKRPRWSPESGISSGEGSSASPNWTEYQWSPGSSSPTSPFSTQDDSSDSEISGRYSPVCSEGEGEVMACASAVGNSAAAEIDAAQVAHDLDELIMDDDESVDEDTPLEDVNKIEPNSKPSRIACVLVLLFRVSHGACNNFGTNQKGLVSNHTLELLTGRDCLNALLDYIERCKTPLGRAARILARVLSNALCLMSVLKHRLALRLHNMSVSSKHPPTQCYQCKQIVRLSKKLLSQLTILAESSYGIGEISYQLLKGSSMMKQTLSLTLPYIVRTEMPLKKYFVDCSALNFLFTIIDESKEAIHDCVTALAKLATNVNIKDPKSLENRFKDKVCVGYDPILDDLALDDIVTFELDDFSTVQANKVFLCQNSEVFSAMLMGRFKESIEKCVRLKDVSKPALEYLLTLLHCGLNSSKCDVQIFPIADRLETNLEVLLLADRFLFEKLKDLLCSAILQFQLTPVTADKIYVWSMGEGMGFLCVESVAYLLTGKMGEIERTRSFEAILNLEYKEQWLDDIKTMILRQLVK